MIEENDYNGTLENSYECNQTLRNELNFVLNNPLGVDMLLDKLNQNKTKTLFLGTPFIFRSSK